jgi:Flp pilus assembly CpaF family ATPase
VGLGQNRAGKAVQGGGVGKTPTTSVRRLIALFSRSSGLVDQEDRGAAIPAARRDRVLHGRRYVTRRHMAINLRKFVLQAHSLDELVALGTRTSQAARFLEAAVASGLNILVSGGTGAGVGIS